MVQLAAHIFDLLHRQGVQHAFGIPGDFALTLYDALAESPIEPVVLTHEPCVGFAADAYSRIRGLGLAVVTYGVGGLNMVNAVAGAYAEKSPLVVLSGGPGVRERLERDLLHHKVKSFDSQRRVFEEVTIYSAILDDPVTAGAHIHRALDQATTFKRPVYLEIPRDMVFAEIPLPDEPPAPAKRTDPAALEEAIEEAVSALQHASFPVVLADTEVHRFGLQERVICLAERLGAPVCSTMLGKSAFPEGHPQYIGIYNGEAGDPRVRDVVEESDCLLMLGAFLSDINLGMFTAHLDPARTIYATSERIRIKHHDYADVLFEDFVDALCARTDLARQDTSAILPMQPRVGPSKGSITTGGLLHEVNQFLDGDTLLVTDVGDPLFFADDIQTKEGTSYLCPAFYASMGFAVPGAIGAELADPFRRVLVLVGDGAFQMTGMELVTASRLGLRPIVIVVNNGAYASLRAMGHRDASFVGVAPIDYAKLGKVLGARSFRAETDEDLRKALATARSASGPTLIEVRVSPDDMSPALQRMSELFAATLKG
jgi:TPP-dependent 2-oxoacid decarboxylase